MLFCGFLLTSCGTHDLPDARSAFYMGDYTRAQNEIGIDDVEGRDAVLVLMERGTIYQAEGEYEKSSKDFIQASDMLELLETYSVSEGAASWMVNDTVYSYQGAPFEQTMLHSMTALNHLAVGNWADAGVEARRAIYSLQPEERGADYPDDAFSRYLAAFVLEMTDDYENAAAQYSLVDELLPDLHVDKRGRFELSVAKSVDEQVTDRELVCFFFLGRSPSMHEVRGDYRYSFSPPRIQIYANEQYLGDAAILTSVQDLAMRTWNIEAPARMAKMAARIAAKETLARQFHGRNGDMGALIRLILIGLLEQQDFRRWETLPQWLAVARVPFPMGCSAFDVKVQSSGTTTGTTIAVRHPVVQRGNVVFSFVRDLPGFNSVKMNKERAKVD